MNFPSLVYFSSASCAENDVNMSYLIFSRLVKVMRVWGTYMDENRGVFQNYGERAGIYDKPHGSVAPCSGRIFGACDIGAQLI
jgi:hypothetical protein